MNMRFFVTDYRDKFYQQNTYETNIVVIEVLKHNQKSFLSFKN